MLEQEIEDSEKEKVKKLNAQVTQEPLKSLKNNKKYSKIIIV